MRLGVGPLRMLIREMIEESIQQDAWGEENVSPGRRELVVLVGPPGVGKSTWIARKFPAGGVYVISRDDIVDEVAGEMGLTYDDMYATPPAGSSPESPADPKFGPVVASPSYMTWAPFSYEKVLAANGEIAKRLKARFEGAVGSGKNIVVDMTNMNAGARKAALAPAAGGDFFKRAVVFKLEDSDLPNLISRVESRARELERSGKRKTITADIINRMVKSFQKVTPDEGFDRVDTVDTFEPGKQ